MRRLRACVVRLWQYAHRARRERELSDELDAHLALDIADRVRAGTDPAEARRQALLGLGGIEQAKEVYRDRHGLPAIDATLQDLRYAVRLMRRHPAFTSLAALTLGLGIGANAAIFTLVDRVLLARLPVPEPERLAVVDLIANRGTQQNVSHPLFRRLSEDTGPVIRLFAAMDGVHRFDVRGPEPDARAEEARVQLVSGAYFDVLGVRASAGRTLAELDDREGAAPAAVLSQAFWRRRFGSDPAIVGRHFYIKELPVTVAGVAPEGFFGEAVGRAPDIWLPLAAQPALEPGANLLADVSVGWLRMMGRLAPGATVQQADAALAVSRTRLGSESSDLGRAQRHFSRLAVSDGSRGLPSFRSQFSLPLRILSAVAAVVLLVACANVANLLLARASARQREIAVRLALGAGRRRLIRQFLTESLCLAALGSAIGLLLASWGSGVLLALLSADDVPLPIDVSLDLRLLAFVAVLALAVVVLFGVAPALAGSRMDAAASFRIAANARTRRRLSPALVVVQVALSLLLLIAAVAFAQTLRNLRTRDVGYSADSLVQIRIRPELSGYTPDQVPELVTRIADRLGSVPGVQSVAPAASGFTTGTSRTCCIAVEGYTPERPDDREVRTTGVATGYFATIRLPLVRGRDFVEADIPPGLRRGTVAVVNEAFVRQYLGGGSGIGRRFGWGDPPKVTYGIEIIGVVRDAVYDDLRQQVRPFVYFPTRRATTFIVRAAGAPDALAPALRRGLADVEPRLEPAISVVVSDLERTLVREKLLARLAGTFSAIAALLAAVGLYGLTAYSVLTRTREIGIRMALGAARTTVLGGELRGALRLAALGIAAGVPAAVLAGRWVQSQMFGISPADPVVLGLCAAALLVVAAAAAFLPARRASRVDPAVALRCE